MSSALWQVTTAVFVAALVAWLALVLVLYLAGRSLGDQVGLKDALRLVPDIIMLLRRLGADPDLPRGLRFRLAALLVYLLLPIDLIPDFIPVIGYADDIVIVILVLRGVVHRAGIERVNHHWPGTAEGLRAVKQLARLKA